MNYKELLSLMLETIKEREGTYLCTVSLGGDNVNILEIKDLEEDIPKSAKPLHENTVLYDFGDSFSTEVLNIYIMNMSDFHEFVKRLSLSSSVHPPQAMRNMNISKFIHNLAVSLHELIGRDNKDKEVKIFCLAKRAGESFTISQEIEYVSVGSRVLELMYEFESSRKTTTVEAYDENGNKITDLNTNRLGDMLVDVSFKNAGGGLFMISHKDTLEGSNKPMLTRDIIDAEVVNADTTDSSIKKLKHKATETKHVEVPGIDYHMLTLAESSTDSKVLEAARVMRYIMRVLNAATSMKLNIDRLYISKSKIVYIDFMTLLDSNSKMKCGDVSSKYKTLRETFKFNDVDIRLIDPENNTNKIPIDTSFMKEDTDMYLKERHIVYCIDLLVAGLGKLN